MKPLVFEHLSPIELKFVSDATGCGSKGADVPDWIFLTACQEHDLAYWVGGDKATRKEADEKFLADMLALSAEQDSWWSRRWYRSLSYVYYWAVRLGASKFFWYGEPRGRDELREAIKASRQAARGAES